MVVMYGDVDINEMTVKVWHDMSLSQRQEWTLNWRRQGMVSFVCLRCGFPTCRGQVGCEACEPKETE